MRRLLGPAALVIGGLIVSWPLLAGNSFLLTFGFQFLVWVTLATSWNLFSGAAGYPSFGHGVFFGVGTYTTTTLLVHTGLPFVAVALLAGLMAALLAGLLGAMLFTSSRFKGDLFGLVTLALAFVMMTVVSNVELLDGGAGVYVRDVVAGQGSVNSPAKLYAFAALITVLTLLIAYLLGRSKWGDGLRAIHDDEDVAESLGVPTYRLKIWGFCLSAGLAGLIGAPQAAFLGYVEVAAVFTLSVPLYVIMMSILGGTTVWYGPLIGAAVVVLLREMLLDLGVPELAQIAIGTLLILVIVFVPKGLGGVFKGRFQPKGVHL